MTISFPQTAAEWAAWLSNPIVAAFMIFMIFRVLNRPVPDGAKIRLSIFSWTDPVKLAFAFVLTIGWSSMVAGFDKSLVNPNWDLAALILARSVGFWTSNQAAYGLVVKILGPVAQRIMTGSITQGDLLNEAFSPGTLVPQQGVSAAQAAATGTA